MHYAHDEDQLYRDSNVYLSTNTMCENVSHTPQGINRTQPPNTVLVLFITSIIVLAGLTANSSRLSIANAPLATLPYDQILVHEVLLERSVYFPA